MHSSWTDRLLKMEPVGCPEKLVINHKIRLRNIPEERRHQLNRRGSQKSLKMSVFRGEFYFSS
jgi:hypothetical protein